MNAGINLHVYVWAWSSSPVCDPQAFIVTIFPLVLMGAQSSPLVSFDAIMYCAQSVRVSGAGRPPVAF